MGEKYAHKIQTPDLLCAINSKVSGIPQRCLHDHTNLWLCYYGQVNSPQLKSGVASKWGSLLFHIIIFGKTLL